MAGGLPINQLSDYLYGKSIRLPRYSVLITFDDGHASNFNLLEIVKKYGFRPTIFLTTGNLDSKRSFWFKIPFNNTEEKGYLKSIPNRERVSYLQLHYSKELQSNENQSLSWKEVRLMSECIDFHSHTVSHPCLTRCAEDELHIEISLSKKTLEEKLKTRVTAIAYPNGDFTEREMQAVAEAGYMLGFSSESGYNDSKTQPFAIKRISTNDTSDINEFILRITGVYHLLKWVCFNLNRIWKLLIK